MYTQDKTQDRKQNNKITLLVAFTKDTNKHNYML